MTRPAARHGWQAAVLLGLIATVAVLLVASIAAVPAAAQAADNSTTTPTPTNTQTPTATPTPTATATETPTSDDTGDTVNDTATSPKNIEYQLEDVDIRNVEFDNGTVIVDVVYHEQATVAITDSGAIKGLGDNSGTGVQFSTYTRSEGEYTLTMRLGSDDELVTIQEGGKMYAASGDRTTLDILATAPTPTIVRWAAISGSIGATISLALIVGALRRRHQNTYKELLSEERVKVEEDPVEGILGRVTRFATTHTYSLLLAAGITAYLTAVLTGHLPGPVELWDSATDAQRVIITGSAIMTIGSFPLMYPLAIRLWDPVKEFVFDVDARDVIDSALGAKGGLAALEDIESADDIDDAVDVLEEQDLTIAAVYSGSPERVAQMRVDGEPAEIQTAGGRGHLVQDFKPAENRADGVWPGLADDFELARERSKIDGNREILEDYATVGRRIVGALPAIRAGADTSAVAAVDRKFGQSVAIDSDPVDDIMDSAVSGTRFERYYSKGQDGEKEEYDDEDEETVNDDSGGDGDGGEGE